MQIMLQLVVEGGSVPGIRSTRNQEEEGNTLVQIESFEQMAENILRFFKQSFNCCMFKTI